MPTVLGLDPRAASLLNSVVASRALSALPAGERPAGAGCLECCSQRCLVLSDTCFPQWLLPEQGHGVQGLCRVSDGARLLRRDSPGSTGCPASALLGWLPHTLYSMAASWAGKRPFAPILQALPRQPWTPAWLWVWLQPACVGPSSPGGSSSCRKSSPLGRLCACSSPRRTWALCMMLLDQLSCQKSRRDSTGLGCSQQVGGLVVHKSSSAAFMSRRRLLGRACPTALSGRLVEVGPWVSFPCASQQLQQTWDCWQRQPCGVCMLANRCLVCMHLRSALRPVCRAALSLCPVYGLGGAADESCTERQPEEHTHRAEQTTFDMCCPDLSPIEIWMASLHSAPCVVPGKSTTLL